MSFIGGELTVIVPTLNESERIEICLTKVREEFSGELLVVDGGSEDDTVLRAANLGARVIRSARGLAVQCNTAAGEASGSVLFFLAADCVPPKGWLSRIQSAASDPYVVAGGFHLGIDEPRWIFRFLAWGGCFRARYFRIALPDQGLFVTRAAYWTVGGMALNSLIPYAKLCLSLKPQGEFVLLPEKMVSSARKWLKNGVIKTTYEHFATYLRFRFGEFN